MPGTVTVGCRLPCGVVMYLERKESFKYHTTEGYKEGERYVERSDKPRVKLNGAARFVGKDSPHDIRAGAGLTYGVDADFFAEWSSHHPELTAGDHPLVFAQTKATEAAAQARDISAARTGFEPLNPTRLPDEFRGKVESAPRA